MIKTYEGQQVHSSLIDALVSQEIRRQQNAQLAEVLAAGRRAQDENALMRRVYNEYWRERIEDAEALYNQNPSPGRIARALGGLYGLAIYLIAKEWRRLMAALGM